MNDKGEKKQRDEKKTYIPVLAEIGMKFHFPDSAPQRNGRLCLLGIGRTLEAEGQGAFIAKGLE
jgi:hypothetical protein